MRRPLPNGYELIIDADSKIKIIITDVIGEGGCCIAYKGNMQVGTSIPVVVKECYPAGLPLARTSESDYSIVVDDKENEEAVLKRFGLMQKRFREGIMSYDDVAQYNSMEEFFGYGQQNGTTYGFTLYSKGRILTDFVEDRYLSLAEIAELLSSVCRSVYRFHRAGYLYLDCKPDNVFVAQGDGIERNLTAYVIDFDSLVRCDGDTCSSGSVHSYTKSWAAPEQLTPGSELSRLTDVFSVGAIFFWCLTGKKLYPEDCDCGENTSERLIQIQNDSFDWRSESAVCSKANDVVINLIKTIIKNSLAIDWKDRERYNYPGEELLKMARDFENLAREVRECEKTKQNVLPVSLNRFKYNSNSTVFRGRKEEIDTLTEMCNSPESFSWVGICGKGGSGKSRLAYELCSRMINQYWLVYPPMHFSSNIADALRDQHANILICLDYIKQDIDKITSFIRDIIENPFEKKYKIRLVLIEREEQDVQINDYAINQYFYRKPIVLSPLTDEQISMLVVDYVINQNPDRMITSDSLDLIVNTLKTVDQEYKRPIYALFIADAWLNNENLRQWDRNAALDYLLCKELKRLSDIVIDQNYGLNKIQRDKYLGSIKYLYALATYLGKIDMRDYDELIYGSYGIHTDDEMLLALMSEYGILSETSFIEGWEPDIIGEYYCIRFFDSLCDANKSDKVRQFMRIVTKTDISAFIRYSDMIFKDYKDIIGKCKWSDDMCCVEYPKEFSCVRKKTFADCSFIRKIVFTGRVNTIYAYAFKGCTNLESIILPSSLEVIEQHAFEDCKNLVEVIPEDGKGKNPSVIKIGICAFYNCISLTRIIIPDSVQSIGTSAFENCSSLVKIIIPSKITELESSVFAGCRALREVVFWKRISVKENCFANCESLERISESKLVSVGNNAFRNCSSMKKMVFSDRLTSLGITAFAECRALEYVDLSNSNITEIPANLFSGCGSLVECRLPDSVNKIGRRSFFDCSRLTDIFAGSSLSIVEKQAFVGCDALKYSGIHGLEYSSFSEADFDSVKNIDNTNKDPNPQSDNTVKSTSSEYPYEGFIFKKITAAELKFVNSLFDEESIIIPSTCVEISNVRFERFKNMKRVVVPKSIRRLPNGIFKNCTKLETVELPGKIKYIPSEAFNGCKSLRNIIFKGNEPNTVPDGTVIGYGAFGGCSKLDRIVLPADLKEIKVGTFLGCCSLSKIEIPQSVKFIGQKAFKFCNVLTDVRLPDGLAFLGTEAFAFCNHLTRVDNLENTKLEVIKNNVFEDCRYLESLSLPRTLKIIGGHAFMNCFRLRITQTFIPDTVYSIGPAAFQKCNSIERIRLPRGITRIEDFTFKECNMLSEVIIPDNVMCIGQSAFYNCNHLSSDLTKIPAGLKNLGVCAFSFCSSLTDISIPNGVSGLPSGLFKGCTNLESVHIPNHIEEIPEDCFKECYNLKKINIPDTLRKINVGAFRDCRSLTSEYLRLPEELFFIGNSAFRYCDNLEEIRIPRGIKTITSAAFEGCGNLRRVIFDHYIDGVGSYAFYECNNLEMFPFKLINYDIGDASFAYCISQKSPVFANTLKSLGSAAFRGCSSIEEISLPDSISKIPGAAFRENVNLVKVTMPDNLILIKKSAFRDCVKLSKVEIRSSYISIGQKAFAGCKALNDIEIPERNNVHFEAFSETPVEESLKNNDSIVWVSGMVKEPKKPND